MLLHWAARLWHSLVTLYIDGSDALLRESQCLQPSLHVLSGAQNDYRQVEESKRCPYNNDYGTDFAAADCVVYRERLLSKLYLHAYECRFSRQLDWDRF